MRARLRKVELLATCYMTRHMASSFNHNGVCVSSPPDFCSFSRDESPWKFLSCPAPCPSLSQLTASCSTHDPEKKNKEKRYAMGTGSIEIRRNP
jgi:hypothetical protein